MYETVFESICIIRLLLSECVTRFGELSHSGIASPDSLLVQYFSSFPHLVFSRDPWRHHTTSTSAVSNLHDPQDLGRRGPRIGYHKGAEKNLNFG